MPVLVYSCAFVSVDSLTSFNAPSLSSCLEGKLSDFQEGAAAAAPVAIHTNLFLRGSGLFLVVANGMQSVEQVLVYTCDKDAARLFG